MESTTSPFPSWRIRLTAITTHTKPADLAKMEYVTENWYQAALDAHSDAEDLILGHLDEFRSSGAMSASGPTAPPGEINHIRLPVIDLPKLSGDYLEWNNFYETFSSIVHNKVYVSGRDKFHYLKSCLQGEAATVIKSLAITSENYAIAWDTLVLVPTLRGDNFKVLKEVRDSVTLALNALKTMGYGVDHWNSIIVHSLKNKLDDTLRLAWEMYLGNSKDYPTFIQFSEFLTRHFNSLQSLGNKPKTSKQESGKSLKSQATSVNSNGCVHCGSNHLLYQCKDYLALTPQARSKFAFSQNLCINCLRPGHNCSNCSSSSRCRKCSKMHHTLLHFDKSGTGGSKARGTTPAVNSASEPEPSSSNTTTHLSVSDTRSVLLATFSARIDAHDAQQLRVPRKRINATIHGVSVNSAQNVRAEAQITLHSLSRHGASLDVTVIILPKITQYIPPTYSTSSFPALSGIDLADNFASTKVPIDVLLGADYFPALVEGPFIHSSDHSLIAQRTIIGWIVSGVLPREGRSHGLTVHHCFDLENTLRDFWELEEVPEVKPMSTEDSLCEEHFVDTEYQLLGHMSPVPMNSDFRVFLPHHAVFKTENQKTKIRVVFNASSKTSTGVSLNDTLFIGPKLQQDITRILMNWRAFRYVGVTDIAKMFRQILVRLEDRKYQNIFWKSDSGELQAFEFNRVTYGTGPAPFLSSRVLRELASTNGADFPPAQDILLNSTYVDDILFGAHDLKQLSSVREQLIALLAKGGFSLSKWAFNQPGTSPLEHTEPHSFFEDPSGSSRVLGIYWDHGDDSFRFRVSPSSIVVLTKRILLSENAKIFDSLGWISPIVITLKQLMQSTWLLKLCWDEEIPEPVQSKWLKCYAQLRDLQSLRIPRWTGRTPNTRKRELIGFCDASELAYGAVVYERITDENGHLSLHLVMSKTKVVTIKTTSIPRLELVATALLVKLLVHVKGSLVGNCDVIRCYSVSQVALAWIAKQPVHWKTFVANRVSYIQTHLPEASWHHVPTKLNPADLCSRGTSAQQLSEDSLWWHGPAFLREPTVNPVQVFETTEESRKVALTAQLDTTQCWFVDKFSSWSKLVRVMAYGALRNAEISELTKHPIILPDCHLTAILIRQTHLDTLHGGLQLTLSTLRQRFWVVTRECAKSSKIMCS
ncbi:uncharacterized protein [Prorops nasuta]|uniref:uncharacterized protein n=1 Tax=Prorops nasuta TaxID=863751 RepID=UPI0034CFCE9F